MEPQPKLNPLLNYTVCPPIGMAYVDRYPHDIRDIIEEGTTYQLAEGKVSTNRFGGSMIIRNYYPSESNCHINTTPHICEQNSPWNKMYQISGCGCGSSDCTCGMGCTCDCNPCRAALH